MTDAPLVSVCLLTYNHANVIESTLNTVLDQSLESYEIILSDDSSDDGTWEVLQAVQMRNPNIKIMRTPRNLGMPGNANYAVKAAKGRFIALLHHDDFYRQDLLEKWVEVLEKHEDVGFVFNQYLLEGSDAVITEDIRDVRIDGEWLIESLLFPRWGCPVRGTAMIRKSTWDRLGGMREEFGLLSDIDLWMRISMDGAVGYVREPLITVRHARPDYYPDIYKGTHWSWRRLAYLYLIHGRNRQEYFSSKGKNGYLAWQWFRFRVSAETAKWIVYALVRGKPEMLATCSESTTPYDMWFLRVLRWVVLVPSRASARLGGA